MDNAPTWSILDQNVFPYIRMRYEFGRQPQFAEDHSRMHCNIKPNPNNRKRVRQKAVFDKNIQAIPPTKNTLMNSNRPVFKSWNYHHTEGGWAKDVNVDEPDIIVRARKKLEKDEAFQNVMPVVTENVEELVKHNNAMHMYAEYYKRKWNYPTDKRRHPYAHVICDFLDPTSTERAVKHICWANDYGRMGVSYCPYDFDPLLRNKPTEAYFFEVEIPSRPEAKIIAPSPVQEMHYHPKDPHSIIAALYNGTVGTWDNRVGPWPQMISDLDISHGDVCSTATWINSKTGSEFFSGGLVASHLDGHVDFWDFIKHPAYPFLSTRITREWPSDTGKFIAVGTNKGKVRLLKPAEYMTTFTKNDRTLLGTIFERETRREKFLEQRHRELRLRKRDKEKAVAEKKKLEEDRAQQIELAKQKEKETGKPVPIPDYSGGRDYDLVYEALHDPILQTQKDFYNELDAEIAEKGLEAFPDKMSKHEMEEQKRETIALRFIAEFMIILCIIKEELSGRNIATDIMLGIVSKLFAGFRNLVCHNVCSAACVPYSCLSIDLIKNHLLTSDRVTRDTCKAFKALVSDNAEYEAGDKTLVLHLCDFLISVGLRCNYTRGYHEYLNLREAFRNLEVQGLDIASRVEYGCKFRNCEAITVCRYVTWEVHFERRTGTAITEFLNRGIFTCDNCDAIQKRRHGILPKLPPLIVLTSQGNSGTLTKVDRSIIINNVPFVCRIFGNKIQQGTQANPLVHSLVHIVRGMELTTVNDDIATQITLKEDDDVEIKWLTFAVYLNSNLL